MVGAGRRERAAEEVKLDIRNMLMALESLKEESLKKKKGDAAQQQEPPQKEVFWAPASLTTKSCADVEYDDDDSMRPTAEPAKEEDIEGAVCSAPCRRAVRNTTPSPSRDMVDARASTGGEDPTAVDVVVTQLALHRLRPPLDFLASPIALLEGTPVSSPPLQCPFARNPHPLTSTMPQ
jgi:hypothetical protein